MQRREHAEKPGEGPSATAAAQREPERDDAKATDEHRLIAGEIADLPR
jgi:hypothetical protein